MKYYLSWFWTVCLSFACPSSSSSRSPLSCVWLGSCLISFFYSFTVQSRLLPTDWIRLVLHYWAWICLVRVCKQIRKQLCMIQNLWWWRLLMIWCEFEMDDDFDLWFVLLIMCYCVNANWILGIDVFVKRNIEWILSDDFDGWFVVCTC